MASFLEYIPEKVICPICGGVHDYRLSDTKLQSIKFFYFSDILPKDLSSEAIWMNVENNKVEVKFNSLSG